MSCDADITALFQTRHDGSGVVETKAPLAQLLSTAIGVQVDNARLNDRMKRTTIAVTSHFTPLECDPTKPQVGGTKPGGGGFPGRRRTVARHLPGRHAYQREWITGEPCSVVTLHLPAHAASAGKSSQVVAPLCQWSSTPAGLSYTSVST